MPFAHETSAAFWREYNGLPRNIREQADKQFALLKDNPRHGSLQFKNVAVRGGEEIWSARVTLGYRALAVRRGETFVWFWIGDHAIYDRLIN